MWEDLTIESLLEYIKKKYPEYTYTIRETVNEEILIKIKNVECTFSISTVDETYTWWKSKKLVHLDVQQIKGTLQGVGLAVDCFEDLDRELELIFKKAREWAGVVDRKKLF